MKNLLFSLPSLFAALATVTAFSTNTAQASNHGQEVSTYISHYSSCGCPVLVDKVYRGNDCYGRPIFSYYTQPMLHRCNRYSQYNGNVFNNSRIIQSPNPHNPHQGYYSNHGVEHSSHYRSSYQNSCNSGRSELRFTFRR